MDLVSSESSNPVGQYTLPPDGEPRLRMSDKEGKSKTLARQHQMHALTCLGITRVGARPDLPIFHHQCRPYKERIPGQDTTAKILSKNMPIIPRYYFLFSIERSISTRLHLYLDQPAWFISLFYTLIIQASVATVLHFVDICLTQQHRNLALHIITLIRQFCF